MLRGLRQRVLKERKKERKTQLAGLLHGYLTLFFFFFFPCCSCLLLHKTFEHDVTYQLSSAQLEGGLHLSSILCWLIPALRSVLYSINFNVFLQEAGLEWSVELVLYRPTSASVHRCT